MNAIVGFVQLKRTSKQTAAKVYHYSGFRVKHQVIHADV